MSDPHWGFIVAAYGVAAAVIGAISLKIWLDYRGLSRALDRMAGGREPDEAP